MASAGEQLERDIMARLEALEGKLGREAVAGVEARQRPAVNPDLDDLVEATVKRAIAKLRPQMEESFRSLVGMRIVAVESRVADLEKVVGRHSASVPDGSDIVDMIVGRAAAEAKTEACMLLNERLEALQEQANLDAVFSAISSADAEAARFAEQLDVVSARFRSLEQAIVDLTQRQSGLEEKSAGKSHVAPVAHEDFEESMPKTASQRKVAATSLHGRLHRLIEKMDRTFPDIAVDTSRSEETLDDADREGGWRPSECARGDASSAPVEPVAMPYGTDLPEAQRQIGAEPGAAESSLVGAVRVVQPVCTSFHSAPSTLLTPTLAAPCKDSSERVRVASPLSSPTAARRGASASAPAADCTGGHRLLGRSVIGRGGGPIAKRPSTMQLASKAHPCKGSTTQGAATSQTTGRGSQTPPPPSSARAQGGQQNGRTERLSAREASASRPASARMFAKS